MMPRLFQPVVFPMIPRNIEPRKFAQQGLSLSGSLPSGELSRLVAVVEDLGDISVELSFSVSESKHRIVTGRVKTKASMVCQRCLEAVSVPLESDVALAMVWTEEEAKHLPSSYDPWVVASDQADVYDIVEEELLLALPVVAFHDYECVDKSLLRSGDVVQPEPAKSNNPFQVLATLKGSSKI